MSLAAYAAQLQDLFAATPFITTTSLSFEERPPDAGIVSGRLVFSDTSQLEFKEFIISRPAVSVIKFSSYR